MILFSFSTKMHNFSIRDDEFTTGSDILTHRNRNDGIEDDNEKGKPFF